MGQRSITQEERQASLLGSAPGGWASGLWKGTELTLYREGGGGPFQGIFCLLVIPSIWEKGRGMWALTRGQAAARPGPLAPGPGPLAPGPGTFHMHPPPHPHFLCGGDTVAKGREGAAID